jgi:hypothetical protein
MHAADVRRWATRAIFCAGWTFLALACSSEAPAPLEGDASPQAAQAECSVERPCKAGAVCLDGHCYPACTSDDQCSTRESCVPSGAQRGVCLARDAGGPMDACDSLACFGGAPVCHPAGSCVACTGEEHCASARPVCDRGLGACVEARAEPCAPCATRDDCGGSDGDLGCIELEDPFERVCLQDQCASQADCAAGFDCLPSRRVCIPRRGSCTAQRAAEVGRPCEDDLDCSALGVVTGAPQAGVCHQGRCAFGCVATPDCPGARLCASGVCTPGESRDAGPEVSAI